MIKLIESSILKDTSFISNLQGSLVTGYFEKLRFYTEDDVKLFGELLESKVLGFFDEKKRSEKEDAEKSKLVNEELIRTLQNLEAYLGDSELYINAAYVKSQSRKEPPEFILTEEQENLSDEELEECVKLSFQQEIANFMLERAAYYKNLSSDQCLQAINQSTRYHHQVEKNKANMANVTPPLPTEKRSTAYPTDLINRIGGEEDFQELISRLANDRAFFQEVKEEMGAIHCKVKDEEGIEWNIITKFNDGIEISLTNISIMSAENSLGEEFVKNPGEISASIMLTANMLPIGAYRFSLATIQDILTTRFKQLTTMGMIKFHMMLIGFPEEVASTMMNGIFSVCPTRQEVQPLVQRICESMVMVTEMLNAAQSGLSFVFASGQEAPDEVPNVPQDERMTAVNDEALGLGTEPALITPQRQLRRTRSSGIPNQESNQSQRNTRPKR